MAKRASKVEEGRPKGILQSFAARGRSMLTLIRGASDAGTPLRAIGELAVELLSPRGETGGSTIARDLLALYDGLSLSDRIAFLNLLADSYGPDQAAIDRAIEAYRDAPSGRSIAALRTATDSRCQQLIRRINLADNGTLALIRMREDALRAQSEIRNFESLDADFSHVFTPWFNIGFLDLRQMAWDSPAKVLHKIIAYEAVHEVHGWDDLRRRVEPDDRRCYAFFHPRMPEEPLIFVEVALTREIPSSIASLLDEHRQPTTARGATTAVFYSISNCQEGLRGIPFGNVLIKRVVELLSHELPMLKTFVTLSPVPAFAPWLKTQMSDDQSVLPPAGRAALAGIDADGWTAATATTAERDAMIVAAARYFIEARTAHGKVVNSVARFHLGNGAQLERINWLGDTSPRGLRSAHGLMVNYLYDPRKIDQNVKRFNELTDVAVNAEVKRLLRT